MFWTITETYANEYSPQCLQQEQKLEQETRWPEAFDHQFYQQFHEW